MTKRNRRKRLHLHLHRPDRHIQRNRILRVRDFRAQQNHSNTNTKLALEHRYRKRECDDQCERQGDESYETGTITKTEFENMWFVKEEAELKHFFDLASVRVSMDETSEIVDFSIDELIFLDSDGPHLMFPRL